MSIIENIKQKVKNIARKVAGEPIPAEYATINIYYNNEIQLSFKTSDKTLNGDTVKLIEYFAMHSDYKILYNYIDKEINVHFLIKKNKGEK